MFFSIWKVLSFNIRIKRIGEVFFSEIKTNNPYNKIIKKEKSNNFFGLLTYQKVWLKKILIKLDMLLWANINTC